MVGVALQVVSEEEAVAATEAAKVQAIKDECEADLAEALPALQAAIKALDTLTKNDITEVKGMKSPPAGEQLASWGWRTSLLGAKKKPSFWHQHFHHSHVKLQS